MLFRSKSSALKLIKLAYLKYPKVYELMKNRHISYNETLDYLIELEDCGWEFVIRPKKKSSVGKIEKNKEKLTALYEQGYHEAEEKYEALLAYLEES